MNAHQEAYNLISKMPDESVRFLIDLINKMTPSFRTGSSETAQSDVSQRIGTGRGVITDPVDFDLWDNEVNALLDGGKL